MKDGMERRAAPGFEVRLAGPEAGRRIAGYAARFDSRSEDLGGFVEVIRPGAFRRSLASGQDVVALVEHDSRGLLGRLSAGTLQLEEDAKGLRFDIDLPDTQAGRDLLVSIERGDMRGSSFGFFVEKGGDVWDHRASPPLRQLSEVRLIEITLTAFPAYPATDVSVAKRSLATSRAPVLRALAGRYLETLH